MKHALLGAMITLTSIMGTQTMASDAINLIREFYQVVDNPDTNTSALSRFFANDFVDHNRPVNAPTQATDRDVALHLFSALSAGFPNATHDLDILEPIGTDRALVYWTFRGVQTGDFFGAAASNRTVEINGVDIFRVNNGRFVEQWHVEELMSLFGQIGMD